MGRRILFTVTMVVLLAALTGGILSAQEGTKQVGVVIAFPDGTEHTEVVTVPTSATAFEVISAAKVDLASANTDFGPAVCGINKVGCAADNCFCSQDHFWAYYHLDPAANTWQASAQGLGAYVPVNGAVEGLIWSAMDANFQPTEQPTVHTFRELSGGAPQALPKTGSGIMLLVLTAGLLLVALGLAERRLRRS
jgi:hypothetical protein